MDDQSPIVKLSEHLIAQPSRLGYLVLGQLEDPSSNPTSLLSVDNSLDKALDRFWRLEGSESAAPCSAEDSQVEQLYATTTTRDADGWYVVRLPFRDDAVPLVENQRDPVKHFLRVEQKLEKDPPVHKATPVCCPKQRSLPNTTCFRTL